MRLPSLNDNRGLDGVRSIFFSGQMRMITHKKSSRMIAYFSDLTTRPLSISNDHVKSFSRSNFKKVADELNKSTCPLKAVLQFHNDEQIPMQKIFEIQNVQSVTRKGVPSLKFILSLLESNGAYAAAATNFANLNDYYQDVSILCFHGPCFQLE